MKTETVETPTCRAVVRWNKDGKGWRVVAVSKKSENGKELEWQS